MLAKRKVKLLGVALLSTILIVNGLFTWRALYEIGERQIAFEDAILTYLSSKETPVSLALDPKVHITMRHYRDGVLIGESYHAGVLTTAGQDWIEDQIGDSPSTTPAQYIGLSNSTDSPSSAWTVIPDEITTGNMSRAQGAYASTGVGTWNVTYVFNPTESNSSRLVGIYYAASGAGLLFSDTIAAVDFLATDTLEIEASHSVT